MSSVGSIEEILKLVGSGSVGVGVIFVVIKFLEYLNNRDKAMTELINTNAQNIERVTSKFNDTIKDYLKESIKVKQELAIKLQEFSDTSRDLRDMTREQSEIIHKMYSELCIKSKTIKNLTRNYEQSQA